MSTAQFENIYHGNAQPGKLRIAQSGLGWKSSDEHESVVTVPQSEIKWMQWTRVARGFQLKIGSNTKSTRLNFDGFQRDDQERLTNLVKQYYNVALESTDTAVRGWNWGIAEVQSQDVAFLVAGKPAFTLPLGTVLNTSITKAEVALEFAAASASTADNLPDDALARKKRLKAMPDEVAEIRFYLPGSAKGMKKKERKAKIKAEEEDGKGKKKQKNDHEEESEGESSGESGGEDGETAAQVFHDAVKEKADVGQVTGEAIATIPDILCLTPRGRFDIDMHADFMRLRGKTYDYRIGYNQIQKLFLLPKPDEVHCQFVVNIDPPIRQGQTRYPYLVMQFIKEEILELDLNLDADALRDTYENHLKAKYDDPAFEVVSILFRVLAKKKVTTPGGFQSHEGHSAVKCNVKANEGQLYLLEKQLLFISKQPTLVPLADIASVTIARVGGALPSARTFDLFVRLKGDSDHPITFAALNKEELTPIEDFLTGKKVRVKNEMEELAAAEADALGGADSSTDDDAAMSVDEDEDKGRKSKKAAKAISNINDIGGEEDDEDSEVDEDFQGGSDSGSGSSDSGNDSDAAMSDAEEKRPKKKAKTS